MSQALRPAIVQYISEYHRVNGQAPSVRTIARQFHISTATFYRLFPDRIAEACRLADVPVPDERIRQAHAANTTRAQELSRTIPASPHTTVQARNALPQRNVSVPWMDVVSSLADRLLRYTSVLGDDFFTSPTYRKLRAVQQHAQERGEPFSAQAILDEGLDAYLATSGHWYWNGRIVPILYTPPAHGSPSTGTPRLLWTPP
jgi:hypothetical protein